MRRSGARDILPQNRFALTRMNMPIAAIAILIVVAVGYILFRTYVSSDLTRGLTLEGLGDETLVVESPALVVRGAVDGGDKVCVEIDRPISPFSVNLIALSSKLMKICLSRVGSPTSPKGTSAAIS